MFNICLSHRILKKYVIPSIRYNERKLYWKGLLSILCLSSSMSWSKFCAGNVRSYRGVSDPLDLAELHNFRLVYFKHKEIFLVVCIVSR